MSVVSSGHAMPTGTVTMLFTDIEGSTRLLKQLGERYGELLADHRRLLREAFAAHGGREMDTQGDAFFFAFARARECRVEAAVEAQRALAAHDVARRRRVPRPDGPAHGRAVGAATRATTGSVCTAARGSPPPRTAGRSCSRAPPPS